VIASTLRRLVVSKIIAAQYVLMEDKARKQDRNGVSFSHGYPSRQLVATAGCAIAPSGQAD
jgi:hypothetical protein